MSSYAPVQQTDGKTLEFTVFLIHSLAGAWQKPYWAVYQILNDLDILDGYIIPCYDVLHTLGQEYLVEDITDLVREKGVQV